MSTLLLQSQVGAAGATSTRKGGKRPYNTIQTNVDDGKKGPRRRKKGEIIYHRTNQTPKHCADANSKSKQLGLVKR